MTSAQTPVRPADETPGQHRGGSLQHAALIAAGAVAIVVLALAPAPLRVLNLPLILLLPGFAVLTAALGPDRPRPLAVRLVAFLATSLVTLALAGTLVGLPGYTFTRERALAGVVLALLACAGVIAWSPRWPGRTATAPDDDVELDGAGSDDPDDRHPPIAGLVVGLAGLVVVLGVATAVHRSPVQFSSLRFAGVEAVEPMADPGSQPVEAPIEVTNETDSRRDYEVSAGIDGILAWGTQRFSLDPGQTWSGTVGGPVPPSGCLQRLAVDLSSPNEPIQRVSRWIAPQAGEPCRRRTTPLSQPVSPPNR